MYLAAIHDRLGQILDRLPAPASAPEDGTVELREPSAPGESAVPPAEKLTEPATPKRRRTPKTKGV
jgi:hypothetical protein